jgi:hypothetical protein
MSNPDENVIVDCLASSNQKLVFEEVAIASIVFLCSE